ncbi:MAG: hypothetical protein AB8G99_19625 [Planctomycetaceae bacterium]
MARIIWLTLNKNDSPHGDVVLSFGPAEQKEDSYYFTLDPHVAPNDESPAKAAKVMASLLEQWVARVSSEADVYLPVGFSDQSMTWLHVANSGSDVTLTLGWSEDEGWSIPPSDVGDQNPTDFQPMDDVESVTVYRPRLLSLLRSNQLDLLEAVAT